MDATLFDYHLPQDRIAQEPTLERDESRLMVVNRANKEATHTRFSNIGHFLPANARYFRNNVAVLKARLHGQRPSGGQVECLLLQPADEPNCWWCLLKPGKKQPLQDSYSKITMKPKSCKLVRTDSTRYALSSFKTNPLPHFPENWNCAPAPLY